MKINSFISKLSGKKIAAIFLLIAISTAGAYATLGEGNGKKEKPRSLLTNKMSLRTGAFSLRSGYSYRGKQVINFDDTKYINLNTVITYQQGHTTYVLPLKKKVSVNLTTQNRVSGATVKIKF